MSRNAYALDKLVEQVGGKAEYGQPDGLDVVREVTFDKRTSRKVGPALQQHLDPRIAELIDNDGALTVVLQGTSPLADDPAPFDLNVGDVPEAEEPVTPDNA